MGPAKPALFAAFETPRRGSRAGWVRLDRRAAVQQLPATRAQLLHAEFRRR
jgi:hypothetical protein